MGNFSVWHPKGLRRLWCIERRPLMLYVKRGCVAPLLSTMADVPRAGLREDQKENIFWVACGPGTGSASCKHLFLLSGARCCFAPIDGFSMYMSC